MPKPNSETSGADDADLVTAKRVLEIEAEALGVLAGSLGEPFLRALDILAQVKGRVVVSGMGKSGHIGHKIASTLSSTGTPALFVHPAEASHGDLGMITTDDAVLALSNSGETSELADLVAYAKRFEIPLICITGGKDSALADAADVALILPASEEACPMGLAPTTSTTVMLALGDAISVALLERKGFSPDEFHVLHPGGKLGHRLIKISDIMHKGEEMPLIDPDALMADALIEMSAKSFGCVGVVEDGVLSGVITDGDLRRHMSAEFLTMSAVDVMTPAPKTIRAQALAAEALGITALRDASLDRVAELSDPILQRRARHVVGENHRVLLATEALRKQDAAEFGRLMDESHASLRDDYQTSIAEVDRLVESLRNAGALGARITGGGFGGCVVALMPARVSDRWWRELSAAHPKASLISRLAGC